MAVKHARVVTDAEALSPVPEIGQTEWNQDHTIENNTITTAMVAGDAITYAKMQNVSATDKLLGRSTAGAGDVEEITCTAAGRALIDDAAASDQRTTLGLGPLAVKTTVATADIDNDAIDNTKLRDSAAVSVIGRAANSSGDPADIEAGSDATYLGRRADAVGFFALQSSDLPAHTHTKANITDFAHQSTHQSGGSDALSGLLDAIARITIRKNTGADVGSRRRINFIEGTGVTLTIADDSANEETDVTIASTPAGGGTLSDVKEGGSVVSNDRANLDFNANDFNITDDAGANDADIAINRNAANGIAGLDASGDLAKTEQHPSTAYTDQPNDFLANVQTFDNIEIDDTDGTPIADRRIGNVDGLLRARTTANVEGRYISKGSIEQITDSEIATGAGIDAAKLHDGSISNTEFGHLNGISSNIQTQIDGKAATSHAHAAADITSGTMATARLGSGTANSSTFLRGDQTYATPPTSSDGTSTIPSAATLTAWQTAVDNAGPRGKVRGAKALDITIAVNSFLRIWSDASGQIDNDGIHLDGQRVRFTAATGAWTTNANGTNKCLIDFGLNSGNASLEITLEHFYVNCARQKVNGIGNGRDFSGVANSKLKFGRISDCMIENVGTDDGSTTGVYYGIEIFHSENVVVLEHNWIDGIQGWSPSHHGAGMHIVDDDNNAGNARVIFNLIGSPGGQNGTYGVHAHAAANVLNRVFIMWNHIFMGSADNSIAVYVQGASGNIDGNRTFFIFGNSLEDVHIGVYANGTSGGVALCIIECNFFEMKGGFRSTGALLKVGANAEVFVNCNSFYGRTDAAGDIFNTWVMEASTRICVFTHNMLFNRKQDGSTGAGTWNKLSGAGTANWRGRDNIGFTTEKNVISSNQAADGASGDKSVAINHLCDLTPNIEDCVPFFTNGTTPVAANSAWRAQVMRIVSVSATQVTVRWHQTAAGAAGEQIKVACHVKTRLPSDT